jgi:hypothetical protein
MPKRRVGRPVLPASLQPPVQRCAHLLARRLRGGDQVELGIPRQQQLDVRLQLGAAPAAQAAATLACGATAPARLAPRASPRRVRCAARLLFLAVWQLVEQWRARHR